MATIRPRAKSRRRLNVWVPEPVHEALVEWAVRHDQTIQSTVRRLLEAEIGYDGPPEEEGAEAGPKVGSVSPVVRVDTSGFTPRMVTSPATPRTVGMTPDEANAKYLELRAKGYDMGKAIRSLSHVPKSWSPPYFEDDEIDPATAQRPHENWSREQYFEYFVRHGHSDQVAQERASPDDPNWVPPPVKWDWNEARKKVNEAAFPELGGAK